MFDGRFDCLNCCGEGGGERGGVQEVVGIYIINNYKQQGSTTMDKMSQVI